MKVIHRLILCRLILQMIFLDFLDDNEDINSAVVINLLDIGIGRIPAKNSEKPKILLIKFSIIILYSVWSLEKQYEFYCG